MGSLSIGHWLIVLLIVVLVFGTKKLKDAGAIWAVRSAISRKAWPVRMTAPSRMPRRSTPRRRANTIRPEPESSGLNLPDQQHV